MKPTIGRIVHFVTEFSKGRPEIHNPAIVVSVLTDGNLMLCVFQWSGTIPAVDVPEDQTAQKPYSWHWPERDE